MIYFMLVFFKMIKLNAQYTTKEVNLFYNFEMTVCAAVPVRTMSHIRKINDALYVHGCRFQRRSFIYYSEYIYQVDKLYTMELSRSLAQ